MRVFLSVSTVSDKRKRCVTCFRIFILSRLIEIRSGYIIKMNTLPKKPPRSSHRFPTRNYLITTLNFVKPVLIAIPVLEHTQIHTNVPGQSSGLSTSLLAHYIDMRSVRAQNKSTHYPYISTSRCHQRQPSRPIFIDSIVTAERTKGEYTARGVTVAATAHCSSLRTRVANRKCPGRFVASQYSSLSPRGCVGCA